MTTKTWQINNLQRELADGYVNKVIFGVNGEDGTYKLSYIAPRVDKNTTSTISATASRFGYVNGSNFVVISIRPIGASNGSEPNQDDKEDGMLENILKPKINL